MLSTGSFNFWHRIRIWTVPTAFLLAVQSPADAETLKEALTAAYLYNPTLKSARAQLRSTDNGVSLAKSGYRPTISATFQDGYDNVRTKLAPSAILPGALPICTQAVPPGVPCNINSSVPLSSLSGGSLGNGPSNPRSAQIALQQNVFDGFRTYNNIKGAEAQVEAGREDLRNAEVTVLLNAATAYMNVVRDQAIVNLRQNNVRVLSEQLRATQDRFKVGEVTRTDVAQAQSGLAQSQADLSIAQGTLYGDQALFAQYIGHPPGTLKDPGPPARLLPKTLQSSIDVAQAESPGILGAIFRERAQEHQVKQVKGQLLPTLSLNATYSAANQPFGLPNVALAEEGRVYGQLTVPLYEAGSVSAQIRAAIETLSQVRQQIDEQRELARANVSSQWGLVIAARGNVAAGKAAVEATQIALQGVREEERVGQRTILDVLNSEQQLLNAQVNLVSFQRDLVVASYGVLAYMGRLTAYDIALEAELYDPTRYYGEVKDAWYGWGAAIEDREDPRVAPIDDPGRAAGQRSADGPAYTQELPQIP
jgi:outer membrane protein